MFCKKIALTAGLTAFVSANLTYSLGVFATQPRDDRAATPESAAMAKLSAPAAISKSEADFFKGGSESPVAMSKSEADFFKGGSESIVARTVGHAEGTRAATGEKTQAYHGHSDPGNAVWNLGSFSYQHEATGPADADVKQLKRLQRQFAIISQQAKSKGLVLSDLEKLNAIDLANQAPLAALDVGGFVDRLSECKRNLLCARSRSFINPRSGRLEAPGLGGNMPQVERDQQRRMDAISTVIERI